jgi:peptidoglycan/xylan/chitin deacetylase (PgdA/CDA1 family)
VSVAAASELFQTAIVRRLPESTQRCYLTFDDGPDPHWTPRALRALRLAGVRATFFVIGSQVAAHSKLLREMHAEGHGIGNHGYSHRHPWTLGSERARREVRDGADAIAQVLGEAPAWFRPSHGRLGPYLAEAALDEGQLVVLWSVSAIDWGPLASPHRIMSRLRGVRLGDIVLLHDGPLRHNHPEYTMRVLPTLLSNLVRCGPTPAALPSPATISG